MKISIYFSILSGIVTPPASKSIFQRACAAALLTPGITHLSNAGISNDDRTALALAQQLGLQLISENEGDLKVRGPKNISPADSILHCGESGLSTRLFTPIAALSGLPLTITGEGSLLRRPLPDLINALTTAGVAISGGPTLPLSIQGPLQIQNLELDGSASSQTATGILFAMAASGIRPLTLTLHHPVSIPYLALTVKVLREFGWPVDWDGSGTFHFSELRKELLLPVKFVVEADWSSAAALIVAGMIAGDISLSGLQEDSVQADHIILDILASAGGNFKWEAGILEVAMSSLKAFSFDATHAPDLVPLLAIAAAVAEGESEISGLHRLAHKESNRVETTAYLLEKFGVSHRFTGNSLFITGQDGFKCDGVAFHSHGDHRIAMAAAVGGLATIGHIVIEDAEAVGKSYPAFFLHLAQLGAFVFDVP